MREIAVSSWIQRLVPLLPKGGKLLDLAAGSGRHSRWCLDHGYSVVAVDRDVEALSVLQSIHSRGADHLTVIQADLEDHSPWPLGDECFDAIIIVNYLWRPLFPSILGALNDNGVLFYETFAAGQETLGKPSNPDFLLESGELLNLVSKPLTVIAYEQGRIELPNGPSIKQRVLATATEDATLLPCA